MSAINNNWVAKFARKTAFFSFNQRLAMSVHSKHIRIHQSLPVIQLETQLDYYYFCAFAAHSNSKKPCYIALWRPRYHSCDYFISARIWMEFNISNSTADSDTNRIPFNRLPFCVANTNTKNRMIWNVFISIIGSTHTHTQSHRSFFSHFS